MSDADPVAPLLDALRADPRIAGHGASVTVELDEGTMTLKGEAKHIAAKRRASALALAFSRGGYRVVDCLRRDVTKRLAEQELALTVAERLAAEPVFADYSLDFEARGERKPLHDAGSGAHVLRVTARDDAVTLTGSVGSLTHKRLAEVIAYWTGACALVVNDLEVVPPEEDSDDELTDAVLMALEKDPLVDAGQLHVGTAGGIVHVEGLTLSHEQHRFVLEDIWLVPGVADVVDRIESH